MQMTWREKTCSIHHSLVHKHTYAAQEVGGTIIWEEGLMVMAWSGIGGMVSNTSNTRFPDIIMSRSPFSSLHCLTGSGGLEQQMPQRLKHNPDSSLIVEFVCAYGNNMLET